MCGALGKVLRDCDCHVVEDKHLYKDRFFFKIERERLFVFKQSKVLFYETLVLTASFSLKHHHWYYPEY